MKKSICNICGGNLINKNGRWICGSCGAYAPEEITNEEVTLLYNARQKLRIADFDAAEELYLDITREYPNCSDAFFGLALAQQGIRFEKDFDGKIIPTCFFLEYQSLFENANYQTAYKLADNEQKIYLNKIANKIESIRKEWLEKASSEEKYDIFLSYKATEIDDASKKTDDYYEAHEIYNELTKLGYKVFFSKEALSNKTGEHYEPYIFNALNNSHLMIVYASKPEHVNSTWVRNEWSRFYKKIKNKEKLDNSLVLIYKGFNPEKELTKPLSDTQNLDRNDLHFIDKLTSYVTRVILESNKTTPKIDRLVIKQIDIKTNKKIQAISKRAYGKNNPTQNQFQFNLIKTRDIGIYSSPKLTNTAESQLQLADIYLKKSVFADALKCYDSILINNPTNDRALLGKLLAQNKCESIESFFKLDLSKFDDYNLLGKVIDYSSKNVSMVIINGLVDYIMKSLNRSEYKLAYNIFVQIAEYNVESVRNSYENIFKCLITSDLYDDFMIQFIESVLSYLLIDEALYKKNLYILIDEMIYSAHYELASKYLKVLETVNKDSYEYYSCSYRISTTQADIIDAFVSYIKNNKLNILQNDIETVSLETANALLEKITDVFYERIEILTGDEKNDLFNMLIQYDYKSLNQLVSDMQYYCIDNPKEENNALFESTLKTFSNNSTDEISKAILNYANAYLKKGDFLFSKKYTELAISYNQDNIELFYNLLIISIGAQTKESAYLNFYKLTDFSIIEKILGLCNSDELIVETLDKIVNQTIKYVEEYGKNSNNRIFDVFNHLVKYYPKNYDDNLIKKLYDMSDACKSNCFFEKAEEYYATITGLDSSEYKAYWGLLQSKLKCKNDKDLIHQTTLISDLYEYNNAITAASSNVKVINYYVDCKVKQEKWIVSHNKRVKFRKIFTKVAAIVCSLVVLGLTIGLLANNVFIPKYKYDNAIELLNDGNYKEAYLRFKDMNYSDSSSQMLVAKAGLDFESGDYESGIQNMHDAGGTTNVIYDTNGGIAGKNNETFNKRMLWIYNNPTRDGYTFYGWNLNEFSIKTKAHNYSASLELKASWKPITYFITYNLDGGVLNNKIETYLTCTDDFSIGQPSKVGYNFVGWSGTGIDSGTLKDVIIKKGSIGHRVYNAHYEAKEYKITYDYGYDGKLNSQKVTYGSSYSLEIPTRLGYELVGWYNDGDYKVDGGGVWTSTRNVTFTAKWTPVTYSITYDLDGGIADNPTTYNIETETFKLTNPTKKGYSFTGWSGSNIDGKSMDVEIAKGTTGNKSYKANFSANSYQIKYYYGYDNKTDIQNVYYDSNIDLIVPSREGYDFLGWYYNNTQVSNGNWIYDYDISLTAKWQAKKYAITYNLNNGYNNPSNPSEYTIDTNTFSLLDPNRNGYDFLGWTGSDISIISKNVTINKGTIGEKSYTANWKPLLNSIIFNGNGNTSGNTNSMQGYTDAHITLNENRFERLGYSFKGWSETPNGAIKYLDGDSIIVPTESIYNLYAIWSPNLNSIDFYGNGADNGNMDTQYMYTDSTGNLNENQYSKKGYHFIGWSNEKEGSVVYSDKSSYIMGISKNITLYAQWKPNNYKISFDPNGGKKTPNDKEVVYDSVYTLETIERDGYCFEGWYYGENKLTDSSGQSLNKYIIASNVTVIAKWSPKTNMLILSDGNNVKKVEGLTDTWVRIPKNEFEKEGYKFIGWSTSINGNVEYYDQDLFYIGTNDTYALYAIFETYTGEVDRSDWTPVSSIDDLKNINNNLEGKYYLINDIDMLNVEWKPIGVLKENSYFRGIFDGNGYTIYNLSSTYGLLSSHDVYGLDRTEFFYGIGLFGNNSGIIRNLKIYNANIDIKYKSTYCDYRHVIFDYLHAGVLCARNFGTIENCIVQGDINVYSNDKIDTSSSGLSFYTTYLREIAIGGICGQNVNGTISCQASVNLKCNYSINMGEIYPNIEDKTEFKSSTYDNFFDKGFIIITMDNGTFRYIDAKWHSIIKLPDAIEEKDGYTFIGWSTKNNGKVEYLAGEECFIPANDKNLILYPIWQPY